MWVKMQALTVRAAEDLNPQPDPPTSIPLQGDEAQEPSLHRVQQLVVNHTVSIAVPWENLEGQKSLGETFSSKM